jgi:large subunit ribosomal protein L25
VSRSFLHVDFYEVAMDRKIYVPVPVAVTGKCIGVENGGVLQLVRHELEVFCLPGNIPDDITVDVSQLDIGDAIHVEDLQLPADVEIPHDVNFTVLTVSATRKETEGGEEAQAEAVAEPAGEKK